MKINTKLVRRGCMIACLCAAQTATPEVSIKFHDDIEVQELRNEVKYLRNELRNEAAAARAAREEAKKYFDALIKTTFSH